MRRSAALFTGLALVVALGVPAAAIPVAPAFGPMIDDKGTYEGQTTCSPTDKPGVKAFRKFVLSQYPKTGTGGISRDCNSGGTSEHKEGRAWDWPVSADNGSERAAADELIAWLLASDNYGNEVAMARRAGIMYLIWNRKSWSVWDGWQTYCVQTKAGCVKPGTSQVRSPHTDHAHFSFTWAGALKKTTFYKPDRSYVTAIAPARGGGYWIAGRNGGVVPFDARRRGDRAGRTKRSAIVDLTPTPSGKGYYLLAGNGRIFTFGDAIDRGDARELSGRAVALRLTASGEGYVVLSANGGALVRGDAAHAGDLAGAGEIAVDLLVTPDGYRIVTASGRVEAFGGAADLGGAANPGAPLTAAAAAGKDGYWLLTAAGRVIARGNARDFGSSDEAPGVAVSIAATRARDGLWLVTDLGAVRTFGAAPDLGDLAP